MATRQPIAEKDLHHWKFLEDFHTVLEQVFGAAQLHPTFADGRRELSYSRYLALFLFGLFNPVVQSMQGLCAASRLPRVQEEICGGSVSLGSFSEAQAVLDPQLLHEVFVQLAAQMPAGRADPRLAHLNLIAQDGSLWRALPRMAWAEYGVGPKGEAKGVRLHLRFHLHQEVPVQAQIGPGKSCERQALRQMCQPGQTNVGDRLYGADYRLLHEIERARGFFVFRIKESSVIHVEETLALSAADQAAQVVRQAWVYLGATPQLRSMRVRLVEVRTATHHLLLVTNLPAQSTPAELVSAIYRRRWSIELYFRWIKCILGCRHFFAESPSGVAIQLYLALIASLLIQLWTGRRANLRTMELLQFYQMGWASTEDLQKLLPRYAATRAKKT